MSKSHADIGHTFASAKKDAATDRMSTHRPLDPMVLINTHFELLAYGVSYRTTVCKHVLNRLTNTHELWVTPQYFSQSTNRHVGHFRAGFIKAHGVDNIFTTPAGGNSGHASYISRDDKVFAQSAIETASSYLAEVDKPRLRTATRRGSLVAALNRLDLANRNMTKGIALDRVDADTLYDLQGTMHFVEMLLDTDDMDEVRAAVRAHIALNHPKNNQSTR
jgi:hypothetical protein